MTDEVKKPARTTTPRKVTPAKTRAKTVAKTEPKAPARPKKGPKIIRNLHAIGVHVRIENPEREKPFRVELKPRGTYGDIKSIPVGLQDSHEYRSGVGILFEVITETEARAIEYPAVGYTPRLDAPILIREADTVIQRFRNVDAEIQQNPRRPVNTGRVGENAGPNVVEMPGSTPAPAPTTNAEILKSTVQPKVTIERGHRVN